jgi:hypothetical protein
MIIFNGLFGISACNSENKPELIKEENLQKIDGLLEEDFQQLKANTLERLQKMIGVWEIKTLICI